MTDHANIATMQLCLACRKFQAMNINIFATYFELKELIQYDYHAKQ